METPMPLTPATGAFEARLRAILPAAAFRDYTDHYRLEPRGSYRGADALLVAPADTGQVAAVVRACHEARVGVVPFGGGTGLVGGQLMQGGPPPVILSLERMAAIRALHPAEDVLVAEAGAILADVQAAAARAGRLFPLGLASEGSCRIGGNLATNAGGVNVLRYGNARALCLGLEAVLPDGSIWHGLTRLRKDNTGYDLRDLLIGAEGTLGVITAASLRLFPRPASETAALLAVASPQAALDLLGLASETLGGSVSAFELMHRNGMVFLAETMPEVRLPLDPAPEWSVLVDVGAAAGLDLDAALEHFMEAGVERGLILDGVLAQNAAHRAAFWTMRETIPEANRRIGSVSSHDISVPLGALPEFIARADAAVTALGPFRINCFGHVGDGNLHYNVFPPQGASAAAFAAQRKPVKMAVHDLVHALGGSVSAEHGIGRLKVDDLERYADPARLAAMRAIKAALDQHGIMNPGAVLRAG
jgi:FAD/FMN-containing dehydrogenase